MNDRSERMAEERRVVVCGSMAFEQEMAEIAGRLQKMGTAAVFPEFDDPTVIAARATDVEGYKAYKREASMRHFDKILDSSTIGVVVANFEKNGRRSYIGPNTFGEIAVAFAAGRRIWLVDGIPEQYEDELTAWGAIDVAHDLSAIHVG